MLILVGQVIQTVSAWLESCPCHSQNQDLPAALKSTWWLRMKVLAGDCGKASAGTVICPLRGCLAPFLAAGRLNAFLDELLDVANTHVIRAAVSLDAPDKKLLAQNFNAAKGRLITFFKIKFGCWQVLPYRAASLGHPDAGISRAILAECVLQFDENRDEEHRHPLTLQLFAEGTLRRELELFLRGAALEALPALNFMAAKFMLIPINERSMEARHRDVALSTRAAPKPSPSFVSMSLRSLEISAHIKQCPYFFFASWRSRAMKCARPAKQPQYLASQITPPSSQTWRVRALFAVGPWGWSCIIAT